jgi:transposase
MYRYCICFAEKYSKSKIKALKSFANGLGQDIDDVENAVAYDYSNGFIEGTTSRLKMISNAQCMCGAENLCWKQN